MREILVYDDYEIHKLGAGGGTQYEEVTTEKATSIYVTDVAKPKGKLIPFGRTEQRQLTGKNKISLLNAVRDVSTSVTSSNIEVNSFNMAGKNAWSNKSFVFNNLKVNTDYAISSIFKSTIATVCRMTIYGTNVLQYTTSDLNKLGESNSETLVANTPTSFSATFNSGEYQYIVFRFWNNSSSTALSENTDMLVSNIQLEEGSTATDYEPYCGRCTKSKSRLSTRN